jgi:hypothetical protein
MSPEQAAAESLDARSDLFGVASVLYELAALDTLFPEKEPDDIRALMARDEAARRANALTGAYGPLAPILVRALQRDPEARYSTAHAMGKALTALLPDPVQAREHLLRFQAQMVGLADGGASPARERPRSASTFAAPTPALPVAAGNELHVFRTPKQARDPRRDRFLFQLGAVIVLSIALGVTAFFGFRVVTEHLRRATSIPVEDDGTVPEVGGRHDAVPARVDKVVAPPVKPTLAAPKPAPAKPAAEPAKEPLIDGKPARITPSSTTDP